MYSNYKRCRCNKYSCDKIINLAQNIIKFNNGMYSYYRDEYYPLTYFSQNNSSKELELLLLKNVTSLTIN